MTNSRIADMPDRVAAGQTVGNRLLTRIPESEFQLLQPYLEYVCLELGVTPMREHEPIDSVYFVNRGIISMLVTTADGRSVEVGIVGREDMLGLQLMVGLEDLSQRWIVQVPGDGFRVKAAVMKRILPSMPELNRMLVRQLGIRWVQLAQNAACNRLHNIRQRLARWLLLTRDRIDSEIIVTTHDSLAKLVGTDRPTVSVALGELQQDGAIAVARGLISVANRALLERFCCECYAIFQQFNAELGLS